MLVLADYFNAFNRRDDIEGMLEDLLRKCPIHCLRDEIPRKCPVHRSWPVKFPSSTVWTLSDNFAILQFEVKNVCVPTTFTFTNSQTPLKFRHTDSLCTNNFHFHKLSDTFLNCGIMTLAWLPCSLVAQWKIDKQIKMIDKRNCFKSPIWWFMECMAAQKYQIQNTKYKKCQIRTKY